MLSSKQILDAVSGEPGTGGLGGRVAALHRSTRPGTGTPMSHTTFLRELKAMHTAAPKPPTGYLHPAYKARLAPPSGGSVDRPGTGGRRGEATRPGLDESDRMWLGRLPTDPEQVSYEDAVTLAGMAASLSPMASPSDARLVSSIWEPVREVHDRRQAEAAIAQTRALPEPQIPRSAFDALADSYAAEFPQLRPEEAIDRASVDLNAVLDRRRAAILQKGMDAHAALEQARNSTATRTSLTAPAGATPIRF